MKYLALVSLFLLTSFAQASIITADFRTESDLPYCCGNGALVYENLLSPVGAGVELDSSHFVENPSSWGGGVVFMDLDPTTNILTLDSQDDWDFELFVATISNIVFSGNEVITGITLIEGNLTTLNLTEILSFTDNSVSITYDVLAGNDGFDFNNSVASFQIQTSATEVPAPASLLIVALGLLALRLRK